MSTDEGAAPQVPGPKPERLKIKGDWKAAVKTAIPKKKPPEGFPSEGQDDEKDADAPMDADT